MSDEPNVNSTPTGESTPAAPINTPSTSPAETFGDDAPNWIKSDPKLLAAHKAAPAPGAEPTVPAATPAAPVAPAATPAAPTAAPAGQLPQFDAQTISRAVSDGVRQALPPPAAPSVSDADMAKQLGIFTATPETFQAILGIAPEKPEQVKALNDALQGVARQAVTIAKVLYQQDLQAFRQEMSPYMTMIRSAEAERQKTLFNTEHKDLAGYEPLVRQVFETTLASGQKFASVDEARSFVATKTRELLKSVGITPAAPAATRQAATPRTTTPQSRPMSPTSMGGRNGGSGATKPAGTIESVWGNKG